MADNFDRLAPWLAEIASRFDDRARAKLSRRIGMVLRQANARRIAANTQPDGSAMEPRKERKSVVKEKVRKSGRMFKRMRLARNLKISSDANHAVITFDSKLADAAEVHHFGLRDRVGRFRGAPTVLYPSRELLGIAGHDYIAVQDILLDHIENR